MRRPHYRKSTWALVVWCVLIALWAIAGLNGTHCSGNYGQACDAGKAAGIGIILAVGFCGFVVLSLIWIMSRKSVRPPESSRTR